MPYEMFEDWCTAPTVQDVMTMWETAEGFRALDSMSCLPPDPDHVSLLMADRAISRAVARARKLDRKALAQLLAIAPAELRLLLLCEVVPRLRASSEGRAAVGDR